MKKDKGGYVLIYVVVVIILMCIVAAGCCTAALNNVKVQREAVVQLQNRCDAESAPEMFMARVSVASESLGGSEFDTPAAAVQAAKAEFEKLPGKLADDVELLGCGWETELRYTANIAAKARSTAVRAEVAFDLNVNVVPHTKTVEIIKEVETENGETETVKETVTVTTYSYTVKAVSEYLGFETESTGGAP